MLDIVIPTLNEEHFIGNLLESLTKQTVKNFKVYLSDGISEDKTIQIAKKFEDKLDLKIIINKQRGVSHQRNEGAKAGCNSGILFLDADVILHPNFLKVFLQEIENKNTDLANCWINPLSKKRIDKILFKIYNLLILEIGKYIYPTGVGLDLYSTRKVFNRINGFNEDLKICEDLDFVVRATKLNYKFNAFRKPKIYTSTRRLEVEGRLKFLNQIIKAIILIITTNKMPTQKDIYYPMNLNYEKLLKNKSISKNKSLQILLKLKTYKKIINLTKKINAKKYLHKTTFNKIKNYIKKPFN